MVLGRGEKPVVYYFGRGIFNFLWVKYVFIDFCSFYAYLSLSCSPTPPQPCLFDLTICITYFKSKFKNFEIKN